ncbi:Tetratricopeptide repeat [Popillia japonica]|uniref:Tetratricopeptide repeat n=1 Tax=Popillia japonica TaxID=7064 RepID=A0AAW1M0T1_POPJA
MAELSTHDKAILNCIFNPNLPLTDCYEEELNEEIKDIGIDSLEYKQASSLELEAIQQVENGKFDEALKIFEKAVQIAPNKASLYNNRAQLYLLRGEIPVAFEDLNQAVQLSENNLLYNKTLCQALCQRGLIYRKRDDIESARSDFEKAAKLGSKFAKSQLVELNPYAALCNQMLRKVMDELK